MISYDILLACVDNCKRLASCTNNKEVYLTVLPAHSREGHLQYLQSLGADLADTARWGWWCWEICLCLFCWQGGWSRRLWTGDLIPNITVHICREVEQTEHPPTRLRLALWRVAAERASEALVMISYLISHSISYHMYVWYHTWY